MNSEQNRPKKPGTEPADKKDGYLNYQWSKGYLPTENPKQDEVTTEEERYQ